jgi:hypothetical protein
MTGSDHPAEDVDPLDLVELAHAAATARSLLGYSIEGAAEALDIPVSIVRDAEDGVIPINDELRVRMEECYGIDLESLLRKSPEYNPRTQIGYDAAQGVLRIGTLGVRFRMGLDSNDVLLRGFSSAIRRQRQLPPSVPLQVRKVDIPLLASLLDLEDPELDDRAQFWFGQTSQTAQGFRKMLKLAKGATVEKAPRRGAA